MLTPITVFIVALFTVWLLKVQKKLMPKHYFYFSELMDGFGPDISLIGVLFRFSILIFSGVLIGILSYFFGFTSTNFHYGVYVGFLTGFFIVWPDFYNPELISPIFQRRKVKLYLLYVLVTLGFSLLAAFGAEFSVIVIKIAQSKFHHQIANLIDPKAIFNNLISNLAYGLSTWFIIGFLIKRYMNFFKPAETSDQSGTAKRDEDAGN